MKVSESKKLKNNLKTGAGVVGLSMFLLVWLALAILPVLIVAHFVIKYW